ncbi:hypothetical protein, partial [Klebsiella pneumoniae]|uniref:hypothetical protein n=1 Tax=Klebsiella pneumoniae TaxID=573 RepID=UPI00396A7878
CPAAGACWHLPRLLGSEAAKRLLFLDEAWSAERALGAGLVGEVVADERHGQLAHLHVPALDERRQAALEELLAGY